MSAKKPAIQSRAGDQVIDAIKINLDVITGRIGGELPQLSSTASTADIINAINSIIARLNAST